MVRPIADPYNTLDEQSSSSHSHISLARSLSDVEEDISNHYVEEEGNQASNAWQTTPQRVLAYSIVKSTITSTTFTQPVTPRILTHPFTPPRMSSPTNNKTTGSNSANANKPTQEESHQTSCNSTSCNALTEIRNTETSSQLSLNTNYNKAVPSVIRAGLANKANLCSLRSWCKVLQTLDGRDKITKLLQYSSRLVAWWWWSNDGSSSILHNRANALKAILTTSRKAFRLGRSLLEIEKLSTLLEYWYYQDPTNAQLSKKTKDPIWKVWGMILKNLGLLSFWAFDNVSFLSGAGVLDDYSLTNKKKRFQKRERLVTSTSRMANRSYFVGAIAGLVTNWRLYMIQRKLVRQMLDDNTIAVTTVEHSQRQQFVLFVALLKSCCDVLVFSNNPGLDFWHKARGKKLNEGVHCVAGLISASTVLYNNYPDAE